MSLLSDGQCAWDRDVGVAFVRRSRGTGGTNPFIAAANFSVPSVEETSEPFHCWFGVCSVSGNCVIDPYRHSTVQSVPATDASVPSAWVDHLWVQKAAVGWPGCVIIDIQSKLS